MKIYGLVTALGLLLGSVQAVIRDEAFVTDFHHQLVGVPQREATFFHRPSSISRASLLYTLSEQGIVGAINPRDGKLVWRHGIGEPKAQAFLTAGTDDNTVITAAGQTISAWDGAEGKLVWQKILTGGKVSDLLVLEQVVKVDRVARKDVIVLLQGERDVVQRRSGETGNILWEHSLGYVFHHNTLLTTKWEWYQPTRVVRC